jgi:hypothetical protein
MAERHWAEVPYVPSATGVTKETPADRYLAVRVTSRQGRLFADGSTRKHFAVVTNLDWRGDRVLEWQREKAGTIELVHDVTKNELGGGVLPCGRFGANAAWYRLVMLAYNVLVAMKLVALPPEFATARPKRLRFAVFEVAARITSHARQLLLRLASLEKWITVLRAGRKALAELWVRRRPYGRGGLGACGASG